MLHGRTGRHRAAPEFVVVVKKTRFSSLGRTRKPVSGTESSGRIWGRAFDDIFRKPIAPPEPETAAGTEVSPGTNAPRILPSIAAAEAEQARIKEGIEAYKARWRVPKPIGKTPKETGRRRGRPPVERIATEAEAVEGPVMRPSRNVPAPVRPRVRVSGIERALPRHLKASAGELRRGERWKRRLPRVCW